MTGEQFNIEGDKTAVEEGDDTISPMGGGLASGQDRYAEQEGYQDDD